MLQAIVILAIILLAICIAPLITLWSINTLAEAALLKFYIPHTFWTYLAVIGLLMIVKPDVNVKK